MTQAGWRSVLVVDSKGKPEGVVSGKDLLPFVENGVDEKLTVRDIMHPALTIDIKARLREAADLISNSTITGWWSSTRMIQTPSRWALFHRLILLPRWPDLDRPGKSR